MPLDQWNLIDDAELDAIIINCMASKHIPGLAASIEKEGKVIRAGAYGVANFTQPTQVAENTLFLLASISRGSIIS